MKYEELYEALSDLEDQVAMTKHELERVEESNDPLSLRNSMQDLASAIKGLGRYKEAVNAAYANKAARDLKSMMLA